MSDKDIKPSTQEAGDSTGVAIIDINREIKTQLADENVQKALLATTFKGLDVQRMKQALLEGRIRGFTFQDFMKKDVYALPYGDKYSIVQAIDYNRKIGMRSGIVGSAEPVFVMTTEKTPADIPKPESASVTVRRKVGEYIGEFTAKVYFDEYYKAGKTWNGKYTPSMWDTKPRTMLAKVAEMHALRKACPEELAQAYIEEEFEKEIAIEESSPKGRLRNAKSESSSLPIGTKAKNEKGKDKTVVTESVEAEEEEDDGGEAGNK